MAALSGRSAGFYRRILAGNGRPERDSSAWTDSVKEAATTSATIVDAWGWPVMAIGFRYCRAGRRISGLAVVEGPARAVVKQSVCFDLEWRETLETTD